jgi:glycosyltransferase involved in cell wall biosynthesis
LHPESCILLYTRFFEFPVSRVIDVLLRVRERVPDARLLVVGKGLSGEEQQLLRLAAQSGLTTADHGTRTTEHGEVSGFKVPGSTLRNTHHASRLTHHASRITHHVSHFTHDVTFLGWLPPDALPDVFSWATVAIYPFDDTLVNRTKCAVKLLDLLAAGVPVVAEAVGQNREMIRHGETGILVKPGDVPAFAEAIVRLLQTPSLRDLLGHAAARDVRDRFSWTRLVQTVEQAYMGTQ